LTLLSLPVSSISRALSTITVTDAAQAAGGGSTRGNRKAASRTRRLGQGPNFTCAKPIIQTSIAIECLGDG
jgi:hypothetical protein